MLRKKVYIEEHHYEYMNVDVPKLGGGKKMLYFRRYRPTTEVRQQNTLYSVLKDNKPIFKDKEEDECHQRMMQVINFDGPLNADEVKRIFRVLGKIRKVEVGEYKQKGKHVYFAIVTFKFEFDLVKAFRPDYFQARINEKFQSVKLKQTKQQKQDYILDMVDKVGITIEENKLQKLKELRDDGYHIVTDKFGNFEVDPQSNKKFVQDLPQLKKKKLQS